MVLVRNKVPFRWHVRVVSVIAGIWLCSIVVGFCVGLGSGEIPLHMANWAFVSFVLSAFLFLPLMQLGTE